MKKSLNVMLLATAMAVSGNLAGMDATPSANSGGESQPNIPVSQIPGDQGKKDIELDPSWIIDPSEVHDKQQQAHEVDEEEDNKESKQQKEKSEEEERTKSRSPKRSTPMTKSESAEPRSIQDVFYSCYGSDTEDADRAVGEFTGLRDSIQGEDFSNLYNCVDAGLQLWQDENGAVNAANSFVKVHADFQGQVQQLEASEKDLAEKANQIEQLQQEIEEKERQIEQLNGEVSKANQKIEGLKAGKQTIQDKVSELEAKNSEQEAKINQLEEVRSLAESLKQSQAEMNEASSMLQNERESLETLKVQLNKQEKELLNLKKKLEDDKRALSNRESELIKSQSDAASERLNYNKKLNELLTASSSVSADKVELTKRERALKLREDEFEESSREFDEKAADFERAKNEHEEQVEKDSNLLRKKNKAFREQKEKFANVLGTPILGKRFDGDLERLFEAACYLKKSSEFVDNGLAEIINKDPREESDSIIEEEEEIFDGNEDGLSLVSDGGFFRFGGGIPTSRENAEKEMRSAIASRMEGIIRGVGEIRSIESFFDTLKNPTKGQRKVESEKNRLAQDLYSTFSEGVKQYMLETEMVVSNENDEDDLGNVSFQIKNEEDAFDFLKGLYESEKLKEESGINAMKSQFAIEPLLNDANEEEEEEEECEELPWSIEEVAKPELVTRFFEVQTILAKKDNRIASLRRRNSALDGELQQAKSKNRRLNQQLSTLKEECDDLQQNVKNQILQNQELQEKNNQLDSDLKNATAKFEKLNEGKAKYESIISQQREQLGDLRKEMDRLKARFAQSLTEASSQDNVLQDQIIIESNATTKLNSRSLERTQNEELEEKKESKIERSRNTPLKPKETIQLNEESADLMSERDERLDESNLSEKVARKKHIKAKEDNSMIERVKPRPDTEVSKKTHNRKGGNPKPKEMDPVSVSNIDDLMIFSNSMRSSTNSKKSKEDSTSSRRSREDASSRRSREVFNQSSVERDMELLEEISKNQKRNFGASYSNLKTDKNAPKKSKK